jgi:hypothetical protein
MPYSRHGSHPDTSNAADAIYRNGGNKGMLAVHRHGAGYAASSTIGVHLA